MGIGWRDRVRVRNEWVTRYGYCIGMELRLRWVERVGFVAKRWVDKEQWWSEVGLQQHD